MFKSFQNHNFNSSIDSEKTSFSRFVRFKE